MRYDKYFQPGQKILLRALDTVDRFEGLTVYFHDLGSGYLDLKLPYGTGPEEAYPFAPGMEFELSANALGMGLRMTVRFREQPDPNLVRLETVSDLQIIQRRLHTRIDTRVGVRYTKGRGTLRSFKKQWEKNVAILKQTDDPAKLPAFPSAPVNLSPGGIRFNVKAPVAVADLCLVLLSLEEGAKPVCALAEVIWLSEEEKDGRRTAGMRFNSILEEDQKKIEKFIQERQRQDKAEKESGRA